MAKIATKKSMSRIISLFSLYSRDKSIRKSEYGRKRAIIGYLQTCLFYDLSLFLGTYPCYFCRNFDHIGGGNCIEVNLLCIVKK